MTDDELDFDYDGEPEIKMSVYDFKPLSPEERRKQKLDENREIDGFDLSKDEDFADADQGDGRLKVKWSRLTEVMLDTSFGADAEKLLGSL